jgi:hypothetical protein
MDLRNVPLPSHILLDPLDEVLTAQGSRYMPEHILQEGTISPNFSFGRFALALFSIEHFKDSELRGPIE